MVEQLGFAMILSSEVNSDELISGIISFLSGSILQAEELSITVVPFSANLGAHSREVSPPAENKARSGLLSTASCNPITSYSLPRNVIILPTDLSDATGNNWVTGKFLSARTFNMI